MISSSPPRFGPCSRSLQARWSSQAQPNRTAPLRSAPGHGAVRTGRPALEHQRPLRWQFLQRQPAGGGTSALVEGELNLALAGTASYGLFNFAGTGNRYSHHRPDRIQHAPVPGAASKVDSADLDSVNPNVTEPVAPFKSAHAGGPGWSLHGRSELPLCGQQSQLLGRTPAFVAAGPGTGGLAQQGHGPGGRVWPCSLRHARRLKVLKLWPSLPKQKNGLLASPQPPSAVAIRSSHV
jgi:hypothetical protein